MRLTSLKLLKNSFIIFFAILLTTCVSNENHFDIDQQYRSDFKKYSVDLATGRIPYLKLTGLFLLKEGINTFGADTTMDMRLSIKGVPTQVGSIALNGDSLTFIGANMVTIMDENDSSFQQGKLVLDETGSSIKLSNGRLIWHVITRSDRYYLRIEDEENSAVEAFTGFERFDLSSAFIFKGKFKYYDQPKMDSVHTQLGGNTTAEFVGFVSFNYKDQQYHLDVDKTGFTMVSDQTTGNETYEGGRYIDLKLPETDGIVSLDFNQLYNPPCTYSDFTTCEYPPRQNKLPFEISAGEKLKSL